MARREGILLGIDIILTLVVIGLVGYPMLHPAKPAGPDPERYRRMAALYEGKGLYQDAVAAYDHLLSEAALTPEEQSQISFQKANLLLDRMSDCNAALPAYLLAKELNPKAVYSTEIDKKSMACFEKMGKSLDAQNILNQATALKQKAQAEKPAEKGAEQGAVVATIDNRNIYLSDLDDAIRDLPTQAQKELAEPKAKRGFLESYLLEQMLYDQALRQGMDKTPEFAKQLARVQRMMLSQKVYQDAIKDKVQIKPEEVSKYYQDHPDEFKDKDGSAIALDKVGDKLGQYLAQQKENEARKNLLDEQSKLHNVKIYEDAFKTNNSK